MITGFYFNSVPRIVPALVLNSLSILVPCIYLYIAIYIYHELAMDV